ncbi:hypothetical protein, partial [Mesorhizobium japonicum]|uniref:hypothetical protein n=1 Tax=Mesorhizobium japonicum TaxID=2066070 RepID=UPI003B5B5764
IDDAVGLSGTGLVAFGAFTFAAESDRLSVLVVPRVVVGRRDGVGWITTIDDAEQLPAPAPLGAEYRILLRPGALGPAGYRSAVAEAVRRI